MAKAELFCKYLNECFDRIFKSLEGDSAAERKEFRVSIKKIRTCLACIEQYHGKEEFKKTRKKLRKYFRRGGLLRELHLYHLWFKRHSMLRLAKLIHLDKQIKESEEPYTNSTDKIKSFIKDSQTLLFSYAEKLSQQEVFAFYIQLLRNNLPLLTGKPEKDRWHESRKQFKRILYAREWQDEEGKQVLSERQAKFLTELQHLIGFWHDNEMMIEWLQAQQAKYEESADIEKKEKARPVFETALHLLVKAGQKFTDRVNKKLDQAVNALEPLEKRLSKIVL